jgi:hypothetical protein
MPRTVSLGELTGVVVRFFLRYGVSGEDTGQIAETVPSIMIGEKASRTLAAP